MGFMSKTKSKRKKKEGENENEDYAVKLVLLGESSVGKTSLAVRFVKGSFHPFQEPTIGASFLSKTVKVDPSEASPVAMPASACTTADEPQKNDGTNGMLGVRN